MRQTDRFSFRVCDRSAVSGTSQTPLLRPQRRSQSHRTRAFTNHSAKHAKQNAHGLALSNSQQSVLFGVRQFWSRKPNPSRQTSHFRFHVRACPQTFCDSNATHEFQSLHGSVSIKISCWNSCFLNLSAESSQLFSLAPKHG